jgi:hypothetical protein
VQFSKQLIDLLGIGTSTLGATLIALGAEVSTFITVVVSCACTILFLSINAFTLTLSRALLCVS